MRRKECQVSRQPEPSTKLAATAANHVHVAEVRRLLVAMAYFALPWDGRIALAPALRPTTAASRGSNGEQAFQRHTRYRVGLREYPTLPIIRVAKDNLPIYLRTLNGRISSGDSRRFSAIPAAARKMIPQVDCGSFHPREIALFRAEESFFMAASFRLHGQHHLWQRQANAARS